MVASVVTARHLPPAEVRGWRWRRLLRTYRSLARTQWDTFVTTIQAQEIAFNRSISAALGGKSAKPLPEFETVKGEDPFEAPPAPTAASSVAAARWAKYREANGLAH